MQNWIDQMASPEVPVNENFEGLAHQEVFAKNPTTASGLTWGYWGGRWGGTLISAGTLALTGSTSNYVVVARATGVASVSTGTTNWNNLADYGRVYKVITDTVVATSIEDHRAGYGGIHGQADASGFDSTHALAIAISDETSAITTGTAKVTFRMPYAFSLTSVRCSLTAAQASGSIFTVDIKETGVSILSTKLTIDNTEKTSVTAAAPAVIGDSPSSLADDAEITIDVFQVGDGTATGLKVYLIGRRA